MENVNIIDSKSWITYLTSQLESHEAGIAQGLAYKLRVSLNKAGKIKTQVLDITSTTQEALYPSELRANLGLTDYSNVYNIVIDIKPTKFNRFTWLKTSSRDIYDAARQRMSERLKEMADFDVGNGCNEVLLHKETGEIIEGSVTNVYFWRDAAWVTPMVGAGNGGGLEGTARRWALNAGICKEGDVEVSSIVEGERVWVSNGVRGFLPGTIVDMAVHVKGVTYDVP